MTDTPELLRAHHLKTLKLPTFLREYDKLARQCAAEGLDHVRFLARLVELELINRERRMIERRIKAAKFPAVKSLPSQACCACPAGQRISFDFKAIPALNKMQVLELARCEWIDRRENVIALGPSGLPFDEWTEVFGAERLTGAILDRLTHHVHILEMNGESYRLRQSKIAKP